MGQLKPEKLTKGATFALDTVVLIYFLEQHPTHYPCTKRLFHRIETGDLAAMISALVFAELLVPAYRVNDIKRAETLVQLLTGFPNLQVVPLSPEISAEAARLRAIHDLRTPDAIHAATALKMGASGIITNDKGFLRLTNRIDVHLFDAGR
ncbi:MAG: type II toxin-antitoxin system VapC family toxin [Desulfobacteraceae bacterium]|nr:MAG: type II toxin-antitoxin system VapC family toxin [Desulfobacteraceae bacterium]